MNAVVVDRTSVLSALGYRQNFVVSSKCEADLVRTLVLVVQLMEPHPENPLNLQQ